MSELLDIPKEKVSGWSGHINKLREIVNNINSNLMLGNFATRKFQDGKWYNIAEFITREENDATTKSNN